MLLHLLQNDPCAMDCAMDYVIANRGWIGGNSDKTGHGSG